MENHFFFQDNGYKLYGTIFVPDHAQTYKEGVVICHPFAEEKKSTQAYLINLARKISDCKVPVIVFDYFGCGDSTGEFKNATLSIWIKNTLGACKLLEEAFELDSITLLGLRLGGFIATKAAELDESIKKLILLEPVIDTNLYFKEILRHKAITELKIFSKIQLSKTDLIQQLDNGNSIDFNGYEITDNFYLDIIKQTPIDFKESKKESTILNISFKDNISKQFASIDNVVLTHVKMAPFWNKLQSVDCTPLYAQISSMF